jgi:hypothetical protein
MTNIYEINTLFGGLLSRIARQRWFVAVLFSLCIGLFSGISVAQGSADSQSRDVRFLIDTSASLQATDALALRKILPDVTANFMLENGDFFGVWTFGEGADATVSFGRINEAKRQAVLADNSYLGADARVRNLRAALEAVAFSNKASTSGVSDVFILTEGPVFSRSSIKDALIEDYIVKSMAPMLADSRIRVNIIEIGNDGELFYRQLAGRTGGQYLSLKGNPYPALAALQFVGSKLNTSVEVASNASVAITGAEGNVAIVIPGADRSKVRLDHPDGWLVSSADAPETIRFDSSGPSTLITLTKEELRRLDLPVSYWAVRGVPAPGAIIVGKPSDFLAGVVPTSAELIAQREKAKTRPVVVPAKVEEAVVAETEEPIEIDESEVSLVSLIKGEVGLEGRYFFQEGSAGQPKENLSIWLQPEIDYLTESGDDLFEITLFGRIDQHDDQRTHADIREMLWTHVGSGWESKVGIGKVFWGVTESQHLVDIINQTDLVEQPDGEEKLGQPMLKLGFEMDWGTWDLFVLPYFRERTFPGEDGRFGYPLPVDIDNPVYESSQEEWHTDFSTRFYGYAGDLEYALSWFWGTTRQPLLIFNGDFANPKSLPLYNIIDQTGLELQYIYDAWLLKFEGISRGGQGDRYAAVTTGFEYTQVGIFGGDSDLGWLMEYLWDERGDDAPTIFDRDIFVGWRWTANDTQSSSALLGVVWDPETDETLVQLEAQRRLAPNMTLDFNMGFYMADEIKGDPQQILQALASPDPNNKLGLLDKEDYMQLVLNWYF